MATSLSGNENSTSEQIQQSELGTEEIASPQISPPGLQRRVLPNRRVHIRGLSSNKWTILEKEDLIYFYYYSQTEVWGIANDVFNSRIQLMNLPPERVKTMTIAKWWSLCSQIHLYITQKKLIKI